MQSKLRALRTPMLGQFFTVKIFSLQQNVNKNDCYLQSSWVVGIPYVTVTVAVPTFFSSGNLCYGCDKNILFRSKS